MFSEYFGALFLERLYLCLFLKIGAILILYALKAMSCRAWIGKTYYSGS